MQDGGLLASWNPRTSRADFLVAKDGSGTNRTVNEALIALARMGHRRTQRIIIYVKSGMYAEKVEIHRDVKNVMLVGDGIDKTIITGSHSVVGDDSTRSSATVGVSGDGFWARDITFENTAGPQKSPGSGTEGELRPRGVLPVQLQSVPRHCLCPLQSTILPRLSSIWHHRFHIW
ncbi:hypothetical protein EV1_040171 [Malus domestica]